MSRADSCKLKQCKLGKIKKPPNFLCQINCPISSDQPQRLLLTLSLRPWKKFKKEELMDLVFGDSRRTVDDFRDVIDRVHNKYEGRASDGKVIESTPDYDYDPNGKHLLRYVGKPTDLMNAHKLFSERKYEEFLKLCHCYDILLKSTSGRTRTPIPPKFDDLLYEENRGLNSLREDSQIYLAKSAMIDKEYESAIKHCIELIKYNPLNDEALPILALAYKNNKNIAHSVSTYNGYKAQTISNNYELLSYSDFIKKAQELLGF